jgi:hypothetical protein
MITKRINLEDENKDILNMEYNISSEYIKMFINLSLHNIMKSSSTKSSKAIKLIEQFKKGNTSSKEDPNQKNFKFLYNQEESLKTKERELLKI